MTKHIILTQFSLFLVGCAAVGPSYKSPDLALSPDFHGGGGQEPGDTVRADWWEVLSDAQLVGYIQDAVTDNHDLKRAQARIREARALRRVASSRFLPSLNSSGSYQVSESSGNGVLGSRGGGGGDLFEAAFDASWEIDVFGGIRRTTESAAVQLEAAADARRDTLLSVISEVARNYTELRGAQRRLELAEKNIRIQSDTLKLVANKFKTGLAPELDVQRAKTQMKTTQSRVPGLRAAMHAAAFRIAVLTGRQPAELLDELAPPRPIPAPPEMVPVGLPSELLLRRPDVRRAERELHAATADIGAATAELYPRFFLTGTAGSQSASFTDFFDSGSRTWSIGPTIRWPIFQGGRIRANVSASEARRDAAYQRFRQAVLTALEDVERSLVDYAEEQLERRELVAAVQASTRAVRLASVLYEKGLSDFLTVLDAERTLRDVEDQLAASETDATVNVIRLYKALGGGWEVFEGADPFAADGAGALERDTIVFKTAPSR